MLGSFDDWKNKFNWIDRYPKMADSFHSIQQMIDQVLPSYELFQSLYNSLKSWEFQNHLDSQFLSTIDNFKSELQIRANYEDILKTHLLMNDENLVLRLKDATLLQESILKNQLIISQLLPDTSDFIFPGERINESFAMIKALSEHYNVPSFINLYAIENTLLYQEFVSNQLIKIENESDTVALRRALVIDYASDLFDLTEGVISSGLIYSEETEEKERKDEKHKNNKEKGGENNRELPLCTPNLYPKINQHISFLYRQDRNIASEDVEEVFYESLPAKINILGNKLITLILEINEISERKDGKPLFKPSTRTMEACQKIPTLISVNEYDFSKIVNLLYFSLYEGAGGNNNRLIVLLNDDQLDPLWNLKHIRLDIAHDVYHGTERSIEKKFMAIGYAYNILIGKSKPHSGKDYMNAQLALYMNINVMLEKILKVLD